MVGRVRQQECYGRLCSWLALLMCGWFWNKVIGTTTGVPADAVIEWDSVATFFDVQIVCGHGLVMGCFADLLNENRYDHIFKSKSRGYFCVLFFAAGPVFSLISTLFGFGALTSENTSTLELAVYGVTAIFQILLVGWHLLYAWAVSTRVIMERRRRQFVSDEMVVDPHWKRIQPFERNFFWTFLLSRSVVIVYFAVYATKIVHSGEYKLHAHHWILSWLFSLWCQFDHPLSLACLAVSAGVFVQGCAVYHASGLRAAPRMVYRYTYTQDDGWFECHACGGDYETCASLCESPPVDGYQGLAECLAKGALQS